MHDRREEIRVQFPDMHHLDVTKKIGEEWTGLGDEQKKPYLDAAVDDKIRYRMEMKEYNKNLMVSGNFSSEKDYVLNNADNSFYSHLAKIG